MAGILPKDANFISAVGGVSSATDTGASMEPFQYDPDTRGLTVHIVGSDVTQPVSGTVTANLSATDNAVLDDIAANQTDGSQETKIVDGSGNVIGATSNALDVNIKSGGAGDGAILDGVTAAIKATVLDYTNSNPLAVRLTDTDGNYIGAGAGTQYTEGDTDSTITGGAILFESNTTTHALSVVNNTTPLPVSDAGGALTVDGTVAVSGTVTVDGSGVTQPVSGTVTANLSATDNAVLDAIESDTTTIAGDTTSIDAKIPALGQALAAASVPVVLTAAQVSTLTPPAAITGFATAANQLPDGHNVTVDNASIAVTGTFWQATQPVSLASVPSHDVTNAGTFAVQADTELTTADLDTGAGTDTRAVVGLVGSASGGGEIIPGSAADGLLVNLGANNDVVVSATDLDVRNLTSTDVVTVTGGAGQTADVKITLDSETVPVTGTFWQATQPISAAALPLPSGAATSALQLPDGHNVTVDNAAGAAAVNIQDGGNVITVDGSVTVSATNLDVRDIDAATDDITVHGDVGILDQLDLTNSNPAAVAIVDGDGTQITSFGGGVQYTEGDTDTTITGTALMFESNTGTSALSAVSNTTPLPVSDAGGAITVDGTLAVTQSGTWDEVGINDSGNAITVDWAGTAPPIGAGTEATALKVTIATDSTGVLSVDDNGGALTVDGTVTANLSATDNTVLDNIDTSLNNIETSVGTLDNAISGSEMQVDVVAALPAGTNAVGKLLPPDIDVTAHTNYARKYYTSAGAATDGIIWSPGAGKRWHVVTMYIQISAAATVTLEDDKAGGDDPVWKAELAANSGVVLSFTEKYPMASGEDAADLTITTTAGNVYVTAVGYEI